MNLRCMYCQTPFTLGRAEMLSAIVAMNEKNQTHYDAQCPRCRRANSIARQRMELFFPNWQTAAKEAVVEAAPKAVVEPAAKTEPASKAAKAKAASKKPAEPKKTAEKKTAAKPAAKKAPAKAKK